MAQSSLHIPWLKLAKRADEFNQLLKRDIVPFPWLNLWGKHDKNTYCFRPDNYNDTYLTTQGANAVGILLTEAGFDPNSKKYKAFEGIAYKWATKEAYCCWAFLGADITGALHIKGCDTDKLVECMQQARHMLSTANKFVDAGSARDTVHCLSAGVKFLKLGGKIIYYSTNHG